MSRESLDASPRRWIGRVLRDRWRIDARLSRGGVGTVYAATHKNNGSRAAIKVLHPEFARDADTRSRFLQEGYAANQVNHPGVVRILDDDTTDDGHAYLVMELLEGELLEARRIRKGGKLPLVDVYEVGEQLLDVLAAAHDKEIVHRDIKPDNLFITHEGRLKVLDFGFAQMRSSFRSEQTATGFLLGTPGFMSPEQAVGNRPQIDAQTDIWAAGATLFTLISGEPVHAGESAAEMLVAAANYAPRSLATVTDGLNPRLVKVVDKAVAFEKADRWPNARIMQLALREVSGKQQAGQVSRRSIPDEVPSVYDDDDDDAGYEATEIAELDSSELVDATTGERMVVTEPYTAREALSKAIRPAPLPAAGRPHPADDDGPTIAATSPIGDHAPHGFQAHPEPVAPYSSSGPDSDDGAPFESGTLIMESPAMARDEGGRGPGSPLGTDGPYGAMAMHAAHPPASAPQPHLPYGQQPHPGDPQSFRAPDVHPSSHHDPRYAPHSVGGEMMYLAPSSPAARTQSVRTQGGSRVLFLVGVAVCTMIVVIVAGLLILSASD